jgi:cell wall-associated NlpC family hydrolase
MGHRRAHMRVAKRHGVAERKARKAADRRRHRTIRVRHLRAARRELALARAARARSRRRKEAAKHRGGVAGLTAAQRSHARRRAVQAAWLAYRNRGVVHYTQGGSRWSGINGGLQSRRGQFPRYADCSSLATWCIWNAIKVAYGARDTVNGLSWRAGYTGTMLSHGARVKSLMPGDCIIYGRGHPGSHTAIYVGGGKVISHGSEAGPLLLPWRYRGDVIAVRRYI